MWIHLLACARPVVEVTPGDDPVNVATVTVDMDSTLEWGLDTSYGHKAAISDSYDLLGLLAEIGRAHV